MGTSLLRRLALIATTFVGLAAGATRAHAQAWVPDQGDLGLELDYNFSRSTNVVTDTTFNFDDTGTQGHEITVGAEYVPIPRLAIAASLPFLAIKYTGTQAFNHGEYDDGDFHTTLTDLRFGARYQVLDDPLALTPHLAVTIPVADYASEGNTTAGRHLKQLHIGVSAGRLIGLASYVHAMYEFTLSEKDDHSEATKKFTQNRSEMSFLLGHKVLDYKMDLHLAANYVFNHGGINLLDIDNNAMYEPGKYASDPEIAPFHDTILKESKFLVGGGIGYDLSPTLTATFDFRYFVEPLSKNTVNASIFALSLQWLPLGP
jgi:hypothetical protein